MSGPAMSGPAMSGTSGDAPEIAVAGPAQAELVAALMAASAGEAWSAREIGRVLALPGALGLIATKIETKIATQPGKVEPVGFALCLWAGGECELLSIGVSPEQRRRGVARALLAEAISRAAGAGAGRMVLEVAEDNAPARAFYEAEGFSAAGRRAGYYRARESTPRDALILERRIAEAVTD